ncbi:PH domain-containing protein [Luteococcus peritonei]|uniref:PH domain-containing protein n=1 Tax=Luteococcus peritonei TaxID=88874 RepID=A0ABW4RY44_9ACTN
MTGLPRVPERSEYRSRPAMAMATGLALVLLGFTAAGWIGLGAAIRAQFTWPQIATLLLILAILVGGMFAIAFSSIVADREGVRVRNVVFRHRYRWDQVLNVQLGDGDAWAYLVLGPDEDHPEPRHQMAMGIQRSDRAAEQQVADLRQVIAVRRAELGLADPTAAPRGTEAPGMG